jgi:hypothetical protein
MGEPSQALGGRVAPSLARRSFEATIAFLVDRASREKDVDAFALVHALVHNAGKPFAFAWLELGANERAVVVDVTGYPLALVPRRDFYEAASVGFGVTYSAREAIDLAAAKGDCGPWEKFIRLFREDIGAKTNER